MTRYVVVWGDKPLASRVLASAGEWLYFHEESAARDHARDWDTASAHLEGWEPATVWPEREVIL